MSQPEITEDAVQPPTLGMYVCEFFARKTVLTGILGALAMLVTLSTLEGALVFHVVLAAFAGLFLFINVRSLRGFARRRMLLDQIAQGDRVKWRKLEPLLLPKQSFGKALRGFGAYAIFATALTSVVGAFDIANATDVVHLVGGIGLFSVGWLYGLSGAYAKSADVYTDEQVQTLVETGQVAEPVTVHA